MKTIDMEIAVMQWLDIRKNLIVPNVSFGMGLHECDILSLTKSGYATEVEIKISRADLLKDKHKSHGHESKRIKSLYFAVPEKLKELALAEIPERSGLLVVHWRSAKKLGYYVTTAREPVVDKYAEKWNDRDRMNLSRLGTMRILGLKQNILRQTNKNGHLQ